MKRLYRIALLVLAGVLLIAVTWIVARATVTQVGLREGLAPLLAMRSSLNSGSTAALPAAAPTSAPAATSAPAQPASALDRAAGNDQVQQVLAQATDERMVVYTGSLSLEVQDAEATVSKIGDILKANQGYIANRSLDRDSQGQVSGSITIRVPPGSLDTVLTQIKALGLKTLHEDAKAEDVTAEYVDLDARRKNLEAYEVELTKLLDTVRQTTGKAEDLLAVYNQLTQVRGQIEEIKGRQNYLQNTSSFATYTIQLVPHQEVQVEGQVGWDPGRTTRQALNSLVLALQGLADLGITFILFILPILILIALPFILLFWIARRVWRSRVPKRAVTA
jgi:Domain of unknown function (DUF4349)